MFYEIIVEAVSKQCTLNTKLNTLHKVKLKIMVSLQYYE